MAIYVLLNYDMIEDFLFCCDRSSPIKVFSHGSERDGAVANCSVYASGARLDGDGHGLAVAHVGRHTRRV